MARQSFWSMGYRGNQLPGHIRERFIWLTVLAIVVVGTSTTMGNTTPLFSAAMMFATLGGSGFGFYVLIHNQRKAQDQKETLVILRRLRGNNIELKANSTRTIRDQLQHTRKLDICIAQLRAVSKQVDEIHGATANFPIVGLTENHKITFKESPTQEASVSKFPEGGQSLAAS